MITPKAHIAATAPYALPEVNVAADKPLVMLAFNESARPPSPLAVKAGYEALASAQLYSDTEWTDLREAIAQIYRIAASQVLCGAGSMELISCLTQCYVGPGDRVLSSQYGYAFFRSAAHAAGADYDQAPERDLSVSVDALLASVRDSTRIVFLANPGNPTGTRIRQDELVRLRDGLDDDILLVIDEAYGEFADGLDESSFDLVSRGNTVVLRTFSKAYGLAGLRVGWGLFPPSIADEIRKLLNPGNIGVVSQNAATAATLDQPYMRATCAETVDRRDRFAGQMRELGLRVPESFTNFVLIRFPNADAAGRADQVLRAEGIMLRNMVGYNLPDCLRATIGSESDMEIVTEHLSDWRRREGVQC